VRIDHGSLARASRLCVAFAETDAWAASGALLDAQPPSDKTVKHTKARTAENLTTLLLHAWLKRERRPRAEPPHA
jgi:hypothetical protein